MKISELVLTETPRDIADVDFNLSDNTVNHSLYSKVTTKKGYTILEAIGPRKLYSSNREYILVNTDSETVIYYMKWKDVFHKLIGARAASQIAVWYQGDVELSSFTKKIFFQYLLPTHDAIITDIDQTSDGKRFWRARVGDAFSMGLNVYYVNLQQMPDKKDPAITLVTTATEFSKLDSSGQVWGNQLKFQTCKLVITSKELI